MADLAHADLVEHARRWLQAQGCTLVVTEMSSGAWEEPDAIGWRGKGSILVECKVSRADLRADRNKPHRRREDLRPGLGNERYYLVTDDLANRCVELMPEAWGVLYVDHHGKVRRMRAAERREADLDSERRLLISACRRLAIASTGGVSVRVYKYPSKNRATLGAEEAAGATSAIGLDDRLKHQIAREVTWRGSPTDFIGDVFECLRNRALAKEVAGG